MARLVLQPPAGEQPSTPVDENHMGKWLGLSGMDRFWEGFAYSTREIGEKNDDDVRLPFPVEIENYFVGS